jgi:hypothetical protein
MTKRLLTTAAGLALTTGLFLASAPLRAEIRFW